MQLILHLCLGGKVSLSSCQAFQDCVSKEFISLKITVLIIWRVFSWSEGFYEFREFCIFDILQKFLICSINLRLKLSEIWNITAVILAIVVILKIVVLNSLKLHIFFLQNRKHFIWMLADKMLNLVLDVRGSLGFIIIRFLLTFPRCTRFEKFR